MPEELTRELEKKCQRGGRKAGVLSLKLRRKISEMEAVVSHTKSC